MSVSISRVCVAVGAAVALTLSACAPDGLSTSPIPSPSSIAPETGSATTAVATATATASPSEAESTPPVQVAALLEAGDDNESVRELQHRLVQLQWFDGPISSTFDDATKLAVEGFQGKRGLPVSGVVDQATWDTLTSMTRMPTSDEMHNVLVPGPVLLAEGDTGEQVKDLQARLKQLDWYQDKIDGVFGSQTSKSVTGFQQKRQIPVTGEVDQRTLDRLTAMTRKPTTDELNNVVAPPKDSAMKLDDRCLEGRVVCISKSQRSLALVIDGAIAMTMDVRFGSELTPTRNGVFSVYWKSRNHVSKLYGSKMPYALFFSGGQAVHYSSDFAERGYNGSSHGCVNVRNKKLVSALFDAVSEGDKVVVY